MHSSLSKHIRHKAHISRFVALLMLTLCLICTGCTANISTGNGDNGGSGNGGNSGSSGGQPGQGAQGIKVFVEPDATDRPITSAIKNAQRSVWVEMYLLSDHTVISALEEAAHRGLDVRVMIEPHPYGGGPTTRKIIDQLNAAGVKTQDTSPGFSLTHEKGMIIDSSTAYIMTSNFTRSALGGSSGSSGITNREYDIIDSNPQDVQAVINIFNADWSHTSPQINAPNLVVSPVNSRSVFTSLINGTHHTLWIEAEEMKDSQIEQAIANATQRGVKVQIILPAPRNSSVDSNNQGINVVKQEGAQVREDTRLYMHAKMMIVDGQKAFVGSENISAPSLDQNRELGIVIADTAVINTLQQTFQQDWGDSQPVY